jgi:hypothetical protein
VRSKLFIKVEIKVVHVSYDAKYYLVTIVVVVAVVFQILHEVLSCLIFDVKAKKIPSWERFMGSVSSSESMMLLFYSGDYLILIYYILKGMSFKTVL